MSHAANAAGSSLIAPHENTHLWAWWTAGSAWGNRGWARRESRVVVMLAVVWVLSLFDYIHTVQGLSSGLVDECNPLALWIAGQGAHALLAFKATLVAAASVGMFHCRRLAFTEVMLGLMVAVLGVVMLRWSAAYALYEFAERMAPPGYPPFP